MKKIEWQKITPYKQISESTGIIYNENGDVSRMYRLKLPVLFTTEYDQMHNLQMDLADRFKALPINSVVNVIGFYYTGKYKSDFSKNLSATMKANLRHWNMKDVLNSELYLVLTLSERPSKPFQGAVKPTLFNKGDYFFSDKPFKSIDLVDKYLEVFNAFETNMNGIDKVSIGKLTALEVRDCIYKFTTFDFNKVATSESAFTIPNTVVNNNGFLLGDNHFKVISMAKEGSDISTGMNNPGLSGPNVSRFGTMDRVKLPVSYLYPVTMGLAFDHITSFSIEIIDNDVAAAALDSSATPLKMVSVFQREARAKLKAIEEYKNALYDADMQSVNVGVNVIIANPNETVLSQMVSDVEGAFTKMNGAKGLVETLEAFPAFMYSLPGNRKDWERNHLSLMELGCCYFPKEVPFREDLEGYYYLDRSGKPVLINFWYSDYVTNTNQVIIGPSGSGKSYMMNGLIDKMIMNDFDIVIIDLGHSYKKICEQKGGKYYNSEDVETLGVNVFNFVKTGDKEKDDKSLFEKKQLVGAILKWILKGDEKIKPEVLRTINNLVGKFYQSDKFEKTIGGLFSMISQYDKVLAPDDIVRKHLDLKDTLMLLQPYVDGENSWVFKDRGLDNNTSKFTVFSLQNLQGQKDVYQIYVLVLVDLIVRKITNLPFHVRKSFAIDEAWSIFKGELAVFVEYLFRTIRKENGQVTVITQNANDIAKSDIADAIKSNTEIKILLKHKDLSEENQKVLRNSLGLTSTDLRLLASLEWKEFFVKFGNEPFIFINDNCPETDLEFSSSPKDRADIEAMKAVTGGERSAILELVEQRKISEEK